MPNAPVPAAGTALPADPLAAALQRFDEVFARIDALHDDNDVEALRFQAARRRMEAAIESMIALLDAADASTEDLEDVGDEEPSLGGFDGRWASPADLDECEPDGDLEPLLGWTQDEAARGVYAPDVGECESDLPWRDDAGGGTRKTPSFDGVSKTARSLAVLPSCREDANLEIPRLSSRLASNGAART